MKNIQELFEQAKFLYQKGNLEEAISLLLQISEDSGEELYAKAQVNLGWIYSQQDKLKDAKVAFSKVPENQIGLYIKAQIFIKIVNSNNHTNLFNI